MTNKTMLVSEIGKEVLRAKDLLDNDWDSLSLVVDLSNGHFAQSGYLYTSRDTVPFTAITPERRKLSQLCNDLKGQIQEESDSSIKQMLIQIRYQDSKMKIDFEFDNVSRWAITPSNMNEMKEALRPSFD
jgi:hypothetical protein